MSSVGAKRDDLQTLRELFAALLAEGKGDEVIEAALAMLSELRSQNSELALRLAQLQRERSGRRGERIDPSQLALMLELLEDPDVGDDEAIDDALEDEGPAEALPRGKPRRRRPSPELPRDVIHHELVAEERRCTTCGIQMRDIGDDVSEVVEFVPAQFRVQEHHRHKYACSRCKETVVTAPGPAKLIEKGLPGPGLLAHTVQSKYQDHLPLTRLREIYRRDGGLEVGVSTLSDWVGAVAEEVKPIVDRIAARALGAHVVQTDASGLAVLDRDHSEGVRRGTMWCSVGDRKHVVFRYAKTGSGEEGPWRYLAGREGYVQADASSVFDRVFDGEGAKAVEVGCWAHARRKLFQLKESELRVAYPLELIGKLYHVEHLADAQKLDPGQRLALRQRRSVGILTRLERWLRRTAAKEPPASALAKACAYSLNHWDALTRFLEDGRLALDNNFCELQIRTLAVGRKNYLFAGSDAGAERAAILYSLLRTCAVQGVDGYAYLKDALKKIAAGWPARRLDDLLPDAWALARAHETSELAA